MMPAKGDGISKRKDDRYMARYTVHTPDGPKRRVIYGRNYREVENKLAEARGDAARGITYDADISLTLNVYSHVLPDMGDAAAGAMDAALG
jgi:hypothetical protein